MPLAGSQKLSDELMFSVVRLECDTPSGVQSGTAFFFAFLLENGKRSPCLITSKHVVEGARQGRFYLPRKDAEGRVHYHEPLEFKVSDFEDKCHPHPDPSVDLVLFFVGATLQAMKAQGSSFPITYLSRSAILPKEQRSALALVEDVAVLGYPAGLADHAHCQPVVRSGITATHAALPYNGSAEFLIDAPCHAGLGGAPVFLRMPAAPATEEFMFPHSPGVALIGVLYAQRQCGVQGDVTLEHIVGRPHGGAGALAALAARYNTPPLGVVVTTEKLLDFEPLVRAMVHGYVSSY
jgi:hypothetical protein